MTSLEQKPMGTPPHFSKNNQSEKATTPRGQEEVKLEFDASPDKAQYHTSRGERVARGPSAKSKDSALRQRLQNAQKTPETVRRDRIPHIRVSSDPDQLQFPQGGEKNKTQKIECDVLEQEVVFEQDSSEMHPQELLTSEQDRISSQIDQFRSSIASLRDSLPEREHRGGAFGMADGFQTAMDLKLAKQETKFKFPEKAMPFVTINPETNRKLITSLQSLTFFSI